MLSVTLEEHLNSDVLLKKFEYARKNNDIVKALHLVEEMLSEEDLEYALRSAEVVLSLNLCEVTVLVALLRRLFFHKPEIRPKIKKMFSANVLELLERYEAFNNLSDRGIRKTENAESFRQLLLATSKDPRLIFICLADHFAKIDYLFRHQLPDTEDVSKETLEIYAPIAGRMGITWLKNRIEDTAFALLQPEIYRELEAKMKERCQLKDHQFSRIVEDVHKALEEAGIAAQVSWRRKHLYSVFEKMQKQNISFDEVYDLLGIRIMTETEGACYVALGIIHRLWTPIPGKFKDYIALPKSNGYQSLHTTVIHYDGTRLEFQIRSEEMDHIAEEGLAAHWSYKENLTSKGVKNKAMTDHYLWMRQLLDGLQECDDPLLFVNYFRDHILPEDIYTLTPRGRVIRLPVGSTPIDFAFAVHTEIGIHYLYGRINNQIVPDDYILRNGDVVEIATGKEPRIDSELLNLAQSNRARSRIRQYLKEERKKDAEESLPSPPPSP